LVEYDSSKTSSFVDAAIFLTCTSSVSMTPYSDVEIFANSFFLKAFDKIASYIDYAKSSSTEKIIVGGKYDKK